MPTVLVILADGFEELEAFAPVDLLRRGEIEVVTASLNENRHATGRSGITAHADAALSAVPGRVVTDGNITTSRGAGTAVEFGLHLVSLLASPAKSAEISKAICL